MRKIGLAVCAVLIAAAVSIAADLYMRDKFVQPLVIRVLDDGKPAVAEVQIRELTAEGSKVIWRGRGSSVSVSLMLPREKIGEVKIDGIPVEIHRPVNLMVVAYTKGKIGFAFLTADPDRAAVKEVKVTLMDAPKVESLQAGAWITAKMTPVLKYAIDEDVMARYEYPDMAKEVESKARPYGSPTWASGSTEVVLDRGISSPYIAGKKI